MCLPVGPLSELRPHGAPHFHMSLLHVREASHLVSPGFYLVFIFHNINIYSFFTSFTFFLKTFLFRLVLGPQQNCKEGTDSSRVPLPLPRTTSPTVDIAHQCDTPVTIMKCLMCAAGMTLMKPDRLSPKDEEWNRPSANRPY